MPRRLTQLLLAALTFLLPFTTRAQDTFRIDDVGLNGYFIPGIATPVRIHIPAQQKSQSLKLDFLLESSGNYERRNEKRTDRFTMDVQANRDEPLDFDAPILIPLGDRVELAVRAFGSNGNLVGEANRQLHPQDYLNYQDVVVAIYCVSTEGCADAQTQIAFGPSSPPSAKINKNLRLLTLSELRNEWWSYSAARAVVVAAPITKVTDRQREALEEFLRAGGTLVLLDDEVGDRNFLASYRRDSFGTRPVGVVHGALYCGSSLKSKTLGHLVNRAVFGPSAYDNQISASSVLSHIGLSFTFPRLRWLVIWLLIYLLFVGPLNFAVLHRLKKLEWGWVSICTVSLLFAGGLYFSSSARRPKQFTIDNVALWWLDSHSPVAVKEVAIRVSSPERAALPVIIDDALVPVAARDFGRYFPRSKDVNFGSGMTDKSNTQTGWDIHFGKPLTVNISVRRWSSEDLFFDGFQTFSGTVHWTTPTQLRNDTGIDFRDGLYIDYSAEKTYSLPNFVSGSEIDLAQLNSRPLYLTDPKSLDNSGNSVRSLNCPPPTGSLSAIQFLCTVFPPSNTRRFFIGHSDAPVPTARLGVPYENRSRLGIVIVDMGTP
jgi:hypothetical protein